MSEKVRRVLMTISGVCIAAFSVGMFDFSNFGMDPFQVFAHGISYHIPISYGLFYSILNLLMLVLVFIFDKKKIGLGTVINIFCVGYIADFFSKLFKSTLAEPTLLVRILFLVAAIVIMCFASSLYFVADMGVSTYDAVALYLSEIQSKIKFKYIRIATDIVCTVIGFCLGATVSVGTLFTAFFMGPLISFFTRTVAKPLRYGKAADKE